jgi:hypothetical protein
MDLRLATLKVVSFYLLHNISILNLSRKFSCVTVVCKNFAIYQNYPNYKWDLIGSLRVNMFHVRAVKEYLNLFNKTNKCTFIKHVLSHIINYQNVSIAFAIINKALRSIKNIIWQLALFLVLAIETSC